jgi:hypothetical protein
MYPTTYYPSQKRRVSGASQGFPATPTLPDRVTRDNSVLLFIDCQVGPLWELEFGPVRGRLADLAGVARRADVPMVVSAIDPENRGPVIPELVAANPCATVITQSAANAWNSDVVRAAVREHGRSILIVVGAAAELSVALCAMSAAADGYGVYAILEAPGEPAESGRWFGDRMIVTTCGLVTGAIETRTSRSPHESSVPRLMVQTTRMSLERRGSR